MSIQNHTHFMARALEQARLAKEDGELPFGAVVVREGSIVSSGRCREAKQKTVTAHAELEAVHDACQSLGTNKLKDSRISHFNYHPA